MTCRIVITGHSFVLLHSLLSKKAGYLKTVYLQNDWQVHTSKSEQQQQQQQQQEIIGNNSVIGN